MSGKLKANYQTGETQVILPADFLDISAEMRQTLLKGWVQSLIDHLNGEIMLFAEGTEKAPSDVADPQDVPLPPHDKVAEPQEEAAAKPKRTSKKAAE